VSPEDDAQQYDAMTEIYLEEVQRLLEGAEDG